MYAAPNRRTTHRLARLDVPTPSWMRAPGECPGMYALESAMDELAIACGIDPVELRIRNEPEVDPESGIPFSSRNLVACLREGAPLRLGRPRPDPRRAPRRALAGRHRRGRLDLPGPPPPSPGAGDRRPDGRYERRHRRGRHRHRRPHRPRRSPPTRSEWSRTDVTVRGSATARWAGAGRRRLDGHRLLGLGGQGGLCDLAIRSSRAAPPGGCRPTPTRGGHRGDAEPYARYAFGAQFAEVRVDVDTGEVRVPRLLGVFAAGRIINPKTARSQLIGGMTMGLSMALLEEGVMDPQFGD